MTPVFVLFDGADRYFTSPTAVYRTLEEAQIASPGEWEYVAHKNYGPPHWYRREVDGWKEWDSYIYELLMDDPWPDSLK